MMESRRESRSHGDASPVPRLTRRGFLRRAAWSGAGLFSAGAGLSLFGERQWPRVRRVRIALPALPAALEGVTICQLSDFHRSALVSEAYLRRAAEMANSLRPDVTVLTGDFVSDTAAAAPSCAAALSGLRAPLGVYAVLGNHDYWTRDVEAVSDPFERAGVRFLTNRSARLTTGGVDWWLCGVDDMWAGRPDLDAALQDVPERGFRMLLCHEPDFADEAARRGIPLQLSGHTHGGQCLLPGRKPLVTPQFGHKYPVGLQRVESSSSLVYTNVGLGVIFPPLRMNCPPEITLATLVKAGPGSARRAA